MKVNGYKSIKIKNKETEQEKQMDIKELILMCVLVFTGTFIAKLIILFLKG